MTDFNAFFLMHNQKGFTLVETIIYIGVVGLVLMTIFVFVTNLLAARGKVQTISDLTYNAQLIEQRLSDAARHAITINVAGSTFGVSPGVLSLNMADASVSPTVFSLTGVDGAVQVKEAGADALRLTTSRVKVTQLLFTNLTSPKDVGIMQVQFTLQSVNLSGSPYDTDQESFQTTLRIPLDQ